MNLSLAIFLVNAAVRSVRVSYDPDVPKHNNAHIIYKSLDPDLKVGDMVVVPTDTRHGYTVGKVLEVDFSIPNYDATTDCRWIVGKVDISAYEKIKEQEAVVTERIGKAEENKKRKELADSLGLANVDLTDLDVVKASVALPAASTVRGDGNTAAATPPATGGADASDPTRDASDAAT